MARIGPDSGTDPNATLAITALGNALKTERQRQNLSVHALSKKAGVSLGMISQLERGQGNPSYHSLFRLAAALEVPLPKLLSRLDGDDMLVRAGSGFHLPVPPNTPATQRVHRELLTPRGETTLQLIRSRLPVGFTNEGAPFRHLGTESVLVESGALLVVHGERRMDLGPGDTVTYGCSTPHWWANAHTGETVVLGAVSPFEG